jgi:hypothetical protein
MYRSSRACSLLISAAPLLLLIACKRQEAPVTYPIGEKVLVGHLSYTVFETQWLTQLGDPSSPRIPQNRYFLVRISIANQGSAELVPPNLAIEDDKGHTYPELSNGEAVPQWTGYLRQIKPASSVQGNLVFDAPPGHYKLKVVNEEGSHAAFIDLPFSFNSEMPGLPGADEIPK